MSTLTSILLEQRLARWAPLLIRLVIGYGFIIHGWAKIHNGPANFEKLLVVLGAPFPDLLGWLVPSIEILGGLAIFLGAFVALTAIPLIGVMVVAIATVHWKYDFSSINTIGLTANGPLFGPPGYEVALLYIAGLASLILGGAGALSIDDVLIRRLKSSPSGKD